MAVPPIPPPLAQLGRRPFSFYPAILHAGHNEWVYRSATWSDVLVRNTKTNEEVSVPRRYLGEISRVDAPVMIVGLLVEMEFREGAVWPAERRVIEMPRAVNDSPRPWAQPRSPSAPAPVIGIRLESDRTSRVGRVVVGGVALGVAGCVLAISLFRGGVLGTHAFYPAISQVELPLAPSDDHGAVVAALGQPSADRWLSTAGRQYELLAYPERKLFVILMGLDRANARYIGAMDGNWHPVHGPGYELLRRLPRF
jgi:hypothetical protein